MSVSAVGFLPGNNLPDTWTLTTVGEVAEVVGGSTPKSKEPRYWGGSVPWLAVSDLTGYKDKYISGGARSITEAGYDSCPTSLLPAGSVVFSSRAPIGYVAIASRELCTSQGFKSFIPSEAISSEYLYWYLRSAKQLIEPLAGGTTFNEVSGRVARTIPVPIPPRAEQDRIVEVIDRLFRQIDHATDSLDQARSATTFQRQAIHAQALSGPWPTVELREVLREPLRNGHSAKASEDGSGIRTLTLTAVTANSFIESNTKLTAADPARVRDLWLEPGDILVERSNTPELVGTAALYRGDPDWAIFPDLLIRVRVTEVVLPEFVELVMRGRQARRYFCTAAQGIAGSMPKISQETVAALTVPLPTLEQQRQIMSYVQRHDSALDESVVDMSEAESLAESLRQTTLQAAFSGRLVPQDPSESAAEIPHRPAVTA